MPIRPEWRKYYDVVWRQEVRPRILERAGHCCERCRAPNHRLVLRARGWWTPATLEAYVFATGGRINGSNLIVLPWRHAGVAEIRLACFPVPTRWVSIVLTVAHLNHDPADRRDENLMALCGWCHFKHDVRFHVHNARDTRQTRKDATRPLLVLLAS